MVNKGEITFQSEDKLQLNYGGLPVSIFFCFSHLLLQVINGTLDISTVIIQGCLSLINILCSGFECLHSWKGSH